jgi:hypothetical protein
MASILPGISELTSVGINIFLVSSSVLWIDDKKLVGLLQKFFELQGHPSGPVMTLEAMFDHPS